MDLKTFKNRLRELDTKNIKDEDLKIIIERTSGVNLFCLLYKDSVVDYFKMR